MVMKYKAKKSYYELPNSENYVSFGSASTHLRLIDGLWVECNPPSELMEHLQEQKSSKKNKKRSE